ncbi:MAG: hypothetical protein KC442_04995 [Thermomicrobiales bacterium]|nr:hypothetical protein [Thermomicrobiales bacterium]
MTKAELDNLRRVEDAIVTAVAAADQPYRSRELFAEIRGVEGYSESLARAAVWFLVDAGRLAFTPNWRLTLAPVRTPNG